ncbi:MAG TPA: hypothetical protein VEC16_03160 [Alphaproteobacteria bacterium]|nr:hypothetical protein [Alphaproteobacteria bacterium]
MKHTTTYLNDGKTDSNYEYGIYGYDDPSLVNIDTDKGFRKTIRTALGFFLAILFITGVWLALDQKLLFGDSWISETYDNPDWRTNEGNLHTFGAWDIETHIWKTEYIRDNFPNFQWNPYWYLGMPLLKYYQSGFYLMNITMMELFNLDAARAALLLVIFGHLVATFMTFIVCYKVSRKIWVSAFASLFLLSNTFISLRSYGWEPITVVFLFLYPLGLYLFLKEPLRPFRFWMILVLGISYLAHPLIWFSLCMFMGLYLLTIALRKTADIEVGAKHYIWQFIGIVFLSLLVGALQFLPQITYEQVSSGAHMGVSYLPFYQVPPNIIKPVNFFFDAGNLKGPGPVVMIVFLLLLIFGYLQYISKNKYRYNLKHHYTLDENPKNRTVKKLHNHELITGITLVLFVMVLFYYLEAYNIFPMNILRSIQYHRIIPEFLITAAVLVAALSNMIYTYKQKVMYYSMLVAFVLVSGIMIYNVQTHWATTDEISSKPEFLHEPIEGRISMPYTDQSFAVRNSFTEKHQVYGYYEQGITNQYADELFSVSSGFHNANLTTIYLKAANVDRLYVNIQEGERDKIVMSRLNGTLEYVATNNSRYHYFDVGLVNPAFAQAVDLAQAENVQKLRPKCRTMFKEVYCESAREEFVSTDIEEIRYLSSYVRLTEEPYDPSISVDMQMYNPDHYTIYVKNASTSTAIVVKMTHDPGFEATINGKEVEITTIGPEFMLIAPKMEGDYIIKLEYSSGAMFAIGVAISVLTIALLSVYFIIYRLNSIKYSRANADAALAKEHAKQFHLYFDKGDM